MTSGPALLTRRIKALALEAGFDKVGVAPAELPPERIEGLARWLAARYEGSMAYMTRDGLKRARAGQVLEGARSVISLAVSYHYPDDTVPPEGAWGKVARYARGRDYHAVIGKKLKRLVRSIGGLAGPGARVKPYVDTGPIMEKAYAREAGVGFYGKNTNILTRDLGSWIFLASLITDLELEFDRPHSASCGACTLCLDACPTGALVRPYELDARKCISYWTIEERAEIPENMRTRLKGWAFGCDICQEVCPHNRKPAVSKEAAFGSEAGAGSWIDLEGVLGLGSDEAFAAAFRGTALKRPKRAGLERNARALLEQSASNGPFPARQGPEGN